MASRKFRFGVSVRGDDLAGIQEFARKAEDLGYSTVVIPDHFGRQMSPLLAITAMAQATTTLRFGTQVLANDFRHPALLAKEAATVDLLSNGSLELGIGTGSQPRDNEQTGLRFDPPGVQVERIRETLRILKAFFTQDEVTLAGKHYQVAGLMGYPKPVQQPHMPILMGARGERMLRLAAREADIIGVMAGPPGGPPGSSLGEKMTVVREAAGDRYASIEFNALYMNVQVDGAPAANPAFANIPGLTGSRDEVIEKLQRDREENDLTYAIIIGTAIDAFAPVVAKLSGT